MSLQRSAIDLFSTNRMHFGLLGRDHERVHLYLDPEREATGATPDRKVCLHPPVLSWTPEDANRPDFERHAYDILKKHKIFLMFHIGLRKIQSHIGI